MLTNEQKAERLEEMAQEQLDMAKTLTPMYSSGLIATCRADAAALLAGAEALEALAVIADGEGDAQMIARQTLARLEEK